MMAISFCGLAPVAGADVVKNQRRLRRLGGPGLEERASRVVGEARVELLGLKAPDLLFRLLQESFAVAHLLGGRCDCGPPRLGLLEMLLLERFEWRDCFFGHARIVLVVVEAWRQPRGVT